MTDDQLEEETSALAARMFGNLWLYVHAKEHAAKLLSGEAGARSESSTVAKSAGGQGRPLLASYQRQAPGSSVVSAAKVCAGRMKAQLHSCMNGDF
jgi:hypothetical protein